jgi:hypothetical protein
MSSAYYESSFRFDSTSAGMAGLGSRVTFERRSMRHNVLHLTILVSVGSLRHNEQAVIPIQSSENPSTDPLSDVLSLVS